MQLYSEKKIDDKNKALQSVRDGRALKTQSMCTVFQLSKGYKRSLVLVIFLCFFFSLVKKMH